MRGRACAGCPWSHNPWPLPLGEGGARAKHTRQARLCKAEGARKQHGVGLHADHIKPPAGLGKAGRGHERAGLRHRQERRGRIEAPLVLPAPQTSLLRLGRPSRSLQQAQQRLRSNRCGKRPLYGLPCHEGARNNHHHCNKENPGLLPPASSCWPSTPTHTSGTGRGKLAQATSQHGRQTHPAAARRQATRGRSHRRASSTPPRPSAPMAMSTHTGCARRWCGNCASIFSHSAVG